MGNCVASHVVIVMQIEMEKNALQSNMPMQCKMSVCTLPQEREVRS